MSHNNNHNNSSSSSSSSTLSQCMAKHFLNSKTSDILLMIHQTKSNHHFDYSYHHDNNQNHYNSQIINNDENELIHESDNDIDDIDDEYDEKEELIYPAHKFVLAARCPVLKRMIYDRTKNDDDARDDVNDDKKKSALSLPSSCKANVPILRVPHVNHPDIMLKLLRYMYTDQMDLDDCCSGDGDHKENVNLQENSSSSSASSSSSNNAESSISPNVNNNNNNNSNDKNENKRMMNLKKLQREMCRLADLLEMPRLKVACGVYSSSNLSVENWRQFYDFAVKTNDVELKGATIDFVARHFSEILGLNDSAIDVQNENDDASSNDKNDVKTRMTNNRTKSSPIVFSYDILEQVLWSDQLQAEEVATFSFINDYIQANQQNLTSEQIERLVRGVRLPIIPLNFLVQVVKPSKLYTSGILPTEAYVEALEYQSIPKLFDANMVENSKRFQPRICNFTFESHECDNVEISMLGRSIKKSQGASEAWDCFAFISAPPLVGQYSALKLSIDSIHNDASGMAVGFWNKNRLETPKYFDIQGVGMSGSVYNGTNLTPSSRRATTGDVFELAFDKATRIGTVKWNGTLYYRSEAYDSSARVYPVVFLFYPGNGLTII